jgi:cobalt-zinc-cadmium efflux system membrane fusion protein
MTLFQRPIIGILLPAIFFNALLALAGCGDAGTSASSDARSNDVHAEEDARGPHGGRLLVDDTFSLEITIFEAGRPPQFRVFAYSEGQPIAPSKFHLEIDLTRLGGQVDRFSFVPESDYLAGSDIVTEPHSFEFSVLAEYAGQQHTWTFEAYEGRTTISASAAAEAGVAVEPVGPATLTGTIDILGRVDFAPNARATLRARFPGQVLAVYKTVGESVKADERLARVESNSSLQPYNIVSPIDGIVIERLTNKGDVAGDAPLFVVGDMNNLIADFHVFASDLGQIEPGQKVTVSAVDGRAVAETGIANFLPTRETATQTIIARAPLPNPDGAWLPGMTVNGQVEVEKRDVPLAVRTDALQRFRDFTVVYARVEDTYEVRMLELGQRTPEWTEVLGGIDTGQEYVIANSFLIKADIEKSGASHDH